MMRLPLRLLAATTAAVTGLLFSVLAALATEATSNTWLNVRSGPGTSYPVVSTLAPGEVVTVEECETSGWCRITRSGPDGWVNSSYLTPAAPGGGSEPNCRFQLTFGPSGPSLSIICGDGGTLPPPPPPPPPPPTAQACFYVGTSYSGAEFCRGAGTSNTLGGGFDNTISSVRLYGGAQAQLCDGTHLSGYCRTIDANTPVLGPLINDRASSLRVYTGVLPPPPPPVTYSTGSIALGPTQTANLDNGGVGVPGGDIRYTAFPPPLRFLTPIGGAQLALGDGSNRGFAGCSAETFSTAQIPFASLPVGTYVCARTGEGRISQFRINGFAGMTVNMGYTTWAF